MDALLSWAQALAGHNGEGSAAAAAASAVAGDGAAAAAAAAAAPALSAVVAEAEACLRPRALASAADSLGLLLLDVAAVLDGGDEKQGKFLVFRVFYFITKKENRERLDASKKTKL